MKLIESSSGSARTHEQLANEVHKLLCDPFATRILRSKVSAWLTIFRRARRELALHHAKARECRAKLKVRQSAASVSKASPKIHIPRPPIAWWQMTPENEGWIAENAPDKNTCAIGILIAWASQDHPQAHAVEQAAKFFPGEGMWKTEAVIPFQNLKALRVARCLSAARFEVEKARHSPEFRPTRLQASTRLRMIRAGEWNDPVYPGKLLVVSLRQPGHVQVVDDADLETMPQPVVGIAVTWPRKTGGALLERDLECLPHVQMHYSDPQQPKTGVRRLDGWLARAAILRRIVSGESQLAAFPKLNAEEWQIAAGCTSAVLRDEANKLLHAAPKKLDLPALAAVVNMNPPDATIIQSAMTELVNRAPKWKAGIGLREELERTERQHTGKPKQRKKRPIRPNLTAAESAAVQAFADCGKSISKAAIKLGKKPSTVRAALKRAQPKLNLKFVKSVSTRRLSRDSRGVEDVADREN